jgi:hypothetical protein
MTAATDALARQNAFAAACVADLPKPRPSVYLLMSIFHSPPWLRLISENDSKGENNE